MFDWKFDFNLIEKVWNAWSKLPGTWQKRCLTLNFQLILVKILTCHVIYTSHSLLKSNTFPVPCTLCYLMRCFFLALCGEWKYMWFKSKHIPAFYKIFLHFILLAQVQKYLHNSYILNFLHLKYYDGIIHEIKVILLIKKWFFYLSCRYFKNPQLFGHDISWWVF